LARLVLSFFLKKIGLAQKLNDFGVAKLEVV
jgi:hypothetical protein